MDGRKRVRFSYDEPEDEGPNREKKVRFPKGKKGSHRAEMELSTIFELEEVTPIKDTDPRVAATARAGRRTLTAEHLEDETSLLADVHKAEEDYESDDNQEEEGGISIEPFNLKQEREEGYFDENGNYVEYRNDDVKDAWLDSAEVDTTLAAKHLKRYAEEEMEYSLSSTDLATIKRRIADALLPGETVLKALRRLKETSTERDRHSKAKAKMSSREKEIFDRLTEDAMKLMDHGEYNVYHEKKETFEREAEGYESLERAKLRSSSQGDASIAKDASAGSHGTPALPDSRNISNSATEASTDMFADDDNDFDVSQNNNWEGDTSGYVYDETSGYYYNSTLGYYYDGNTGLFCNAVSGKWFKFDEDSNSYIEVVLEHQQAEQPVEQS